MYKLYKSNRTGETIGVIKTTESGVVTFLLDIDSSEKEAYLKWLSEGNTPTPAEEQGA